VGPRREGKWKVCGLSDPFVLCVLAERGGERKPRDDRETVADGADLGPEWMDTQSTEIVRVHVCRDLHDYAWHRHDYLRSHSRGMALSAVPKLNVDVCKRTASTDTANGGCMLGSVRASGARILLAQMDLACCRLSTGLTMSDLCRHDLANHSLIPLSRVRVCSMRKLGKEG